MIGWGALLMMLGIGSFILPSMGIQFRLMMPLEEAQPAAGIIVTGLGLLLIVLGVARTNAKKNKLLAAQAPPGQPYYPPPPQAQPQFAPWPGAASMGNCLRCNQVLWIGDSACRSCGLPMNVVAPAPATYAAPPPLAPVHPVAAAEERCPNPQCGHVIRPGKKFCGNCGTAVA